jgi:hypothetical protein
MLPNLCQINNVVELICASYVYIVTLITYLVLPVGWVFLCIV